MFGYFHRRDPDIRVPRSEQWECVVRPEGTVAIMDELGGWREVLCTPFAVTESEGVD